MPKYRRRVATIEAERWRGDNLDAIKAFLGAEFAGLDHGDVVLVRPYDGHGPWRMPVGHWVVREDGRHRCVAPDIFHKTYVVWRLDPELCPLWAFGHDEVIRLYVEEGWSMPRIAAKAGCTANSVRKVLIARGIPRRVGQFTPKGDGAALTGVAHGQRGYEAGCRCRECRDSNATYSRTWRASKAAGQ